MLHKISKVILIFFCVNIVFAVKVQAEVEKAEISVDGLACPFCAYGLEKKLKKLDGVGEVEIYVQKGLAVLKQKPGQSIRFEDLEKAVKDAGFTPGEIKVTAVGKISKLDQTSVFIVTDSEMKLILNDNDKLQKLQAELKDLNAKLRLTGGWNSEAPDGHLAHSQTLTIETFEVLK